MHVTHHSNYCLIHASLWLLVDIYLIQMLFVCEACCNHLLQVCLMSHLLIKEGINVHSYLELSGGVCLWVVSLLQKLKVPLVYSL